MADDTRIPRDNVITVTGKIGRHIEEVTMDDCEWILDPGAEHSEGTHFFIGEIGNTDPLHYWRYACVRWDGCMHLYRAWNYPFTKENNHDRDNDCDYQHICSVENEIDKLKGLLLAIKKYYPSCETD